MLAILKRTYCGTFGVEFMHITDPAEKAWIQERIEGPDKGIAFTDEGKRAILKKLIEAETFERFVHKRHPGTKRFELDGYIERRPHPSSRRADSWSLTRAGHRELERARGVGTAIFAKMLNGFDKTEKAAFEDYLRRCITALGGESPAVAAEPPRKGADRGWRGRAAV
jgi:hypothetical protein